ncbi:predicted protein [Nematostella vectensis]|uniref:RRM domain-containing protein n=1 Tax=Nematostella vectensis TaxID=45351 RepID=A7RKI9_NEMVE|nr:predicted protein [Nematostella vectensis]|eukprot:XP_001640057.1 predicted protein [Nematostella vectensis]
MADDEFDEDYYTEVILSKPPLDQIDIAPVGRARGKIPLDLNKLRLPKRAFGGVDDGKAGRSRGRGEEIKARALGHAGPARIPRERPGQRHEIFSKTAFPSLTTPATKGTGYPIKTVQSQSKRKKDNKSAKTNKKETDSDLAWPSLPVSESMRWEDDEETFHEKSCNGQMPKGPQQNDVASDGKDLIIQNLPKGIQEKDLKELLQLYGNVLVCNIERDSNGDSLGSALVRMESTTECEWVISCYDNQEYPGSSERLHCKFLGE